MQYKENEIQFLNKKGVLSRKIGCIILLISLYSMGTISSMTDSFFITVLLIVLSCFITFLNVFTKLRVNINGLYLWIIPLIICCFFSFKTMYYRDVLFYILMMGVMIQVAGYSGRVLRFMFYLFVIFSIVFAVGEYWQYCYKSSYYEYLFPLFTPHYQGGIERQFRSHKMCTGFTSQTAYSAEYILLGIITVYYYLPKLKRHKIIIYGILLFLAGGLLLTGKRGPLLLLIIALVYTDNKTTSLTRRGVRTVALILVIFTLLFVCYSFILPYLVDSRNGIARLFEYMEEDKDVSNGRWRLFAYAIDGIIENPMFGNGWGWFKQQHYFGVSVHNIYLQLLCECGVLGATPICFVLLFWYLRTRKIIDRIIKSGKKVAIHLKFAHFTQIYILLYGMFGSPIYDYNFLFWFIISIALTYNNKLKMYEAN